jgi:protein TonB
MSNCRVIRSSGDAYVDSNVCDAAMRQMRFSPARDPSGHPIPYEMSYTPTWTPNRW